MALKNADLKAPAAPTRHRSTSITTRRSILGASGAAVASLLLSGSTARASETSAITRGPLFVTDFGAVGDGMTNDTDAINRTILAAAQGGTVYFPAGHYISYSIHLRSNVTLELSAGAIIEAGQSSSTSSTQAFDLPEPSDVSSDYVDFGHKHFQNSLIWGIDLKNVGIVGPGLILGTSLSRGEGKGPIAETPGVANKAIAFKNCHNVTLRDFSIISGGHFAILATGTDNITIDNLLIDTNRDGIDIDCCHNVRITNCSVNSPWDDAIVLKSSFALGRARSTESVSINNCYVTGGYQVGSLYDASCKPFLHDDIMPHDTWIRRIGRIKLGTESNGDFRNIAISNCTFDNSFGLAIESVDGGCIEDISVSNLTMKNVITSPIFIRLGSRLRGPVGMKPGSIRRIVISNVVCSNASSKYSSVFAGIPDHPIEDLSLANVSVHHSGGVHDLKGDAYIPEHESGYPEVDMFGESPSQGIYARHVNGLSVAGISVSTDLPDTRPLFVLEDTEDVMFSHVRGNLIRSYKTFALQDVRRFRVSMAQHIPDTALEAVDKKLI